MVFTYVGTIFTYVCILVNGPMHWRMEAVALLFSGVLVDGLDTSTISWCEEVAVVQFQCMNVESPFYIDIFFTISLGLYIEYLCLNTIGNNFIWKQREFIHLVLIAVVMKFCLWNDVFHPKSCETIPNKIDYPRDFPEVWAAQINLLAGNITYVTYGCSAIFWIDCIGWARFKSI